MTTNTAPVPASTYSDPYPGRKGSERVYETCGRCAGAGVVDYGRVTFAVRTRDGRTATDRFCFECSGAGKVSVLVSSARARARRQATAPAREAARAAERMAARRAEEIEAREEIARWLAARPTVVAALVTYRGRDRFVADLAAQVEGLSRLSERQEAALLKAAERMAAEAASPKADAPEGRQAVTGEVLKVKASETPFGWALKMTVRDDRGFRVYGTVPSAISDVEPGARVTFTATVSRSDRDPSFGFFSRPTKAARL